MNEQNLNEKELKLIKLMNEEKAKLEDGELPSLTQRLDYIEHIKPYRLIQLVSGIGSGKNFFTGELIKAGFRVLLITSRKATANAQSQKLGTGRWIELDSILNAEDDSWGESPDSKFRNVICTNACIEKYAKYQVKRGNKDTYLWKYFDYIILDEVHSLTMDATYSDTPFHVEMFLKHCFRLNRNLKIILMTGTPEPVEWLIPDEEDNKDFKNWDFCKECRRVYPKNIIIDDVKNRIFRIINCINKGEKVIYFANSLKHIEDVYEDLIRYGIAEEKIFVSHSKNLHSDILSESLYKKSESYQNTLENDEILPEEVQVLLTTSVSKEGININNTDIKVMISDSHIKTDLIQMAGRVRNSLNELFIINNCFQHSDSYKEPDADICKSCVSGIKNDAEILFNKYDKGKLIKKIEQEFKYIRYTIFKDNFMLYKGKIEGEKIAHISKNEFNSYVNSWIDRCFVEYDESNNKERLLTGKEKFQKWFPESKVFMETHYIDARAAGISLVDDYIEKNGYVGLYIEEKEIEKILDDLNNLISFYQHLSITKKTPYVKIGRLLKSWSHYEYKNMGDNNTLSGCIIANSN